MSIPNVDAVRTWVRDGTTNVMPLRCAAGNLHRNVPNLGNPREIAERLLRGETLATKHATFAVKGR